MSLFGELIATIQSPIPLSIVPLCLLLLLGCFAYILHLRRNLTDYEKIKSEAEQGKVQALIKEEKHEVEGKQMRDAFLAHFSHELRTPLNVIIGYAELLEEICIEEETTHLVPDIRKIATAAHHLQTVVNDMLELSKIESGMVETRYEPCPSANLLQALAKTVGPAFANHGNRLVTSFVPTEVEVDVSKIRQLLTHILSFANHHVSQGTIRLSLREEQGDNVRWLVFTVADDGLSVANKALEALTTGFSCVFEDTTGEKGLGMGLAISRGLANIMGGSLEVGNQKDGNQLIVRLPARHTNTHRLAQNQAPSSLLNKTILIISDDAPNAGLLKEALHEQGLVVELAINRSDGLAKAEAHPPDVIVIDGMMPKMDGWGTLEGLSKDKRLCHTPVIMTSQMDEVSKTYALGAIGFLNKPVSEARILSVLNRYLPPGEGRNILMVEDDRVSRKMLRKSLERVEWVVGEAENGQAALASLARSRPNLILLDLMMPEMSGYEFFGELRKHPEWRTIPVLFVSSALVTDESKLGVPGRFWHLSNQGDFADKTFQAKILEQIRFFTETSDSQPLKGMTHHD